MIGLHWNMINKICTQSSWQILYLDVCVFDFRSQA